MESWCASLCTLLLLLLPPPSPLPLQVAAQSEEAIELYLAASRPRQALAIINTQLSSSIALAAGDAAAARGLAGGSASTGVC